MKLIDFYPQKGTFKPGESVIFEVELQAENPTQAEIQLTIWHLVDIISSISKTVKLSPGEQRLYISFTPPQESPKGYGVLCELFSEGGQVVSNKTTAFDVLQDWTIYPRYGFLTEFIPDREDINTTLTSLSRYHVNGLQFYDWQYKHECLLPPNQEYIDPLGRSLSLKTVRDLIQAAHNHGIAAMPYVAIYAATLDFWKDHPQWALYNEVGESLTFMDFLGLMDPSPDKPWIDHLQKTCAQVLSELDFDGLHVDQYGDPRVAYNYRGAQIDLPDAFVKFIDNFKRENPSTAIVFNAVKNWPIEALATSSQDFIYIEVWPPETSYHELVKIVSLARKLSSGKPVVIAIYLPEDRISNIRLADALIISCGGTRIEIGEKNRLLTDPYFPNHKPILEEFVPILRNYLDFVVCYGELIGPHADHDESIPISIPRDIWGTVRRSTGWLTVCIVNLSGLSEAGWDHDHSAPIRMENVPVSISYPGKVRQVWCGNPDANELHLQPVSWISNLGRIQTEITILEYWCILAFELDDNTSEKL